MFGWVGLMLEGASPLFESAIGIFSGVWSRFWASDAITLILSGIVLGFVFAIVLGSLAQSTKGEGHTKDKGSKETEISGGSMGESQYACV